MTTYFIVSKNLQSKNNTWGSGIRTNTLNTFFSNLGQVFEIKFENIENNKVLLTSLIDGNLIQTSIDSSYRSLSVSSLFSLITFFYINKYDQLRNGFNIHIAKILSLKQIKLTSKNLLIFRYFDSYLNFFSNKSKVNFLIDIDDSPWDLLKLSKTNYRNSVYYHLAQMILIVNLFILKRKFRFEGLLFSSNNKFAGVSKKMVIPNMFISNSVKFVGKNKRCILFVGNLAHSPNYEGLIWFLLKVFPFLNDEIEFYIIGDNNSVIEQKFKDNRIKWLGVVKDIDIYYGDAGLVVIPIFNGAGSCVKTIEAIKYGKKIISTNLGIRGIENPDILGNIFITDNEKIWIQFINQFFTSGLYLNNLNYGNLNQFNLDLKLKEFKKHFEI